MIQKKANTKKVTQKLDNVTENAGIRRQSKKVTENTKNGNE